MDDERAAQPEDAGGADIPPPGDAQGDDGPAARPGDGHAGLGGGTAHDAEGAGTGEETADDDAAEDAAPNDAAAGAADHAASSPARGLAALFGSRRPRAARKPRSHPYAAEPTGRRESSLDPAVVTVLWLAVATGMAVGGWMLQSRYGFTDLYSVLHPGWRTGTLVVLFTSLALLAFGFSRRRWGRRLTLAGWMLFAAYWALTARDLMVSGGQNSDQDLVYAVSAIIGVYFFTYLAYHEWLSLDRGVENRALRFLGVTTFVAAGGYFLIDKIEPLRVGLIMVVGRHTQWMLNLFGQGDAKGLAYTTSATDAHAPVTMFYPSTYCHPGRIDGVGAYCAENGIGVVNTYPQPQGWLESLLMYAPDGDLLIVPVSIIMACTALQSIMLFVGLFSGTKAPWRKKALLTVAVAAVVYILNLLRNTGIIWFYGQGHASFWMMHSAIGWGGSLLAMVLIAVVAFRLLPSLLDDLFAVLDLQHRDGPIERFLRLGRRRPTGPSPG